MNHDQQIKEILLLLQELQGSLKDNDIKTAQEIGYKIRFLTYSIWG